MKTAIIVQTAMAALLLSSAAFAEEEDMAESTFTKAPQGALEITTGTGYSQGFGSIAKQSVGLRDLGGAGFGGQLGVGYRIDPRFMVGVYGEFARYGQGDSTPDGSRASTVGAGVQAQYHFMPYNRIDPWVGLGTGWRGYWVTNDTVATHSLHGIDAVRGTVGVGYRINQSVSINPFIGASLSTFLSEQRSDQTEFASVDSPSVNTFVFAGIGGRFDIGGKQVSAAQEVASR